MSGQYAGIGEYVTSRFLPVSWTVAITTAFVFGVLAAFIAIHLSDRREAEGNDTSRDPVSEIVWMSALFGGLAAIAWIAFSIYTYHQLEVNEAFRKQLNVGEHDLGVVVLVGMIFLGIVYGLCVTGIAVPTLMVLGFLWVHVCEPLLVRGKPVSESLVQSLEEERASDPLVDWFVRTLTKASHWFDPLLRDRSIEKEQEKEAQWERERREYRQGVREGRRQHEEETAAEVESIRKGKERTDRQSRDDARWDCEMIYHLNSAVLTECGLERDIFNKLLDRYLPSDDFPPADIERRADDFKKMIEERLREAGGPSQLREGPQNAQEAKEWYDAEMAANKVLPDSDPLKHTRRSEIMQTYREMLKRISQRG